MNEHGTPRERDVQVVRVLLEEGRDLTKDVMSKRFGIPERRFRAAVSELRKRGYPVVAFSEHGSTYHRARSLDELEHHIAELASRRNDLDEQITALRRATSHYGAGKQLALIR